MTASLEPPIPPDADLRHMPSYMIDVQALLDSDLAAFGDPAANWFAVLSWCASLHQLPAGSLPDDDAMLAYIVRLGRDVRTWRKMRAKGALKGWIRHSDGRLYHPVVTKKVLDLLQISRAGRAGGLASGEKRRGRKNNQAIEIIDSGINDRSISASSENEKSLKREANNRRERKGIEGNRRDLEIAVSGNPPAREPPSGNRHGLPAPSAQKPTDPPTAMGQCASAQQSLIPLDQAQPPPKRSRKVKTALPPDWRLPDNGWSYAAGKGLTGDRIEQEAERFRDYHLSRGNLMANWEAAWRTWVGNTGKFSAPVAGGYRQNDPPSRADSAIQGIKNFLIRNGELP